MALTRDSLALLLVAVPIAVLAFVVLRLISIVLELVRYIFRERR